MNSNKGILFLSGLFAPVVFWVTLALCGSMYDNYSLLRNLVSELGAAGTETSALFAFGLILCSALSLIFVIGLIRECKKLRISTFPVIIILTFTFSIAGAAVFPMPHRLHGILGSPSVALFLSPILAGILWRRESSLKGLLSISMFSLLVMLLGLLVFFPNVLNEYVGLKQRFFHSGWSIWFVYLSVTFSGLSEHSWVQKIKRITKRVNSGSA